MHHYSLCPPPALTFSGRKVSQTLSWKQRGSNSLYFGCPERHSRASASLAKAGFNFQLGRLQRTRPGGTPEVFNSGYQSRHPVFCIGTASPVQSLLPKERLKNKPGFPSGHRSAALLTAVVPLPKRTAPPRVPLAGRQ